MRLENGNSNFEVNQESFLPPSKRAARRILQRAFVLTGRDKPLRQHIREVQFTTLWVLEDWDLAWTVIIDRGKIEFERRPAKHPDLTFTWPTAEEFFATAGLSSQPRRGLGSADLLSRSAVVPNVSGGDLAGKAADLKSRSALPAPSESHMALADNPELRRIAGSLLQCFLGYLGHVLRNPVDGAGESLL